MKKLDPVFEEKEKICVTTGVYSSAENVKNTQLMVIYSRQDNEYYRVYVAITHNKDNVEKLKQHYKYKGNDIYVRELDVKILNFRVNKTIYLLLESSGDNEIERLKNK